jgi:CPA2 family monovalent cation:H+ antiporter-2
MNADDLLNLKIVLILTVGFSFASLLGYFSQKAKLYPLFGYLVAGYLLVP